MEHLKRIKREKKYTGSMLTMCADTILTPDGNQVTWDYIEHNGAAAVIPVLPDGRILMVRQYRNALDRETLEIPAGGLNGDEPTIIAAARELEEETGYKSNHLEPLISVVTAVAFCNEVIDVFTATDLVKTQQHLDPDEYIEVLAFEPEELVEMIFDGKIQDSKSIAAIMSYLKKYKHINRDK